MIDQHKMYTFIYWFIFSIYVALTIIICHITNIEINEFGLIAIKHMSKYLLNCFPLIITYPFIHMINEHCYESGVYRRFIKRRLKYEYHEYSYQCLECNRYYVTRSRIKMFFIEIYHSFICEWKR